MIKYQLQCDRAHEFEAWFKSISDFDRQAGSGLVACPACGSTSVERRAMAPAIVRRHSATPSAGDAMQATAGGSPGALPPIDVLRAWKRQVLANSEDVGEKFADEARKIHYGDADERAIRGQTTPEDAEALHEEGVPFGILPVLPEEQN